MEEFGLEMAELGDQNGFNPLRSWGEEVASLARLFELVQLQQKFAEYEYFLSSES